MSSDIYISTFPFGRDDRLPLQMLRDSGLSFQVNSRARKLTPQELAEEAAGCRVLVAGTENLTPLIEISKSLQLISRVGIGLDSVPLELCRSRRVRVSYTPHAVTPAVAELAVGLMLDIMRRITFADRELRTGGWTRPYGRRLGDSVVGIVGYGKIGRRVAHLLAAFSPEEILIYDKENRSQDLDEVSRFCRIRQCNLDEILAVSDIISLHVPLTGKTRGMIDLDALRRMKPTAALVNTSRGGIVDEADLFAALSQGIVAGAAIDVFDQEPYSGELLRLENVVLTQHMASCAFDCRARMETEAVAEAIRFLRGESLLNEVSEVEYEYQRE